MSDGFTTEEEKATVWEILRTTGAFREGHFALATTGLHYDQFFQVPRALQMSENARILCVALGRALRRAGVLHHMQAGNRLTLVATEDTGIPMAFWTGEHLKADRILWLSRTNGEWAFRPFIDIDRKDQAILFDDALLTGSTMKGAIGYLRGRGAAVEAVAAVVDRRKEGGDIEGFPVYSVLRSPGRSWAPARCPLCRARKPLKKIDLL